MFYAVTGITVGAVILFLVCTYLPTHDSHLHCLGIGICVSIARTGDQQLEWSLQLLLLLQATTAACCVYHYHYHQQSES